MSAAKSFTFICGADEFLVGRVGHERYAALAAEVTDEFSREVLSGFAANVGEVEAVVNRFRDSVQTVAMFGRRVVWFALAGCATWVALESAKAWSIF